MFQTLGESKIASMVESKDFRKGIIQLEWYVPCLNSLYIRLGFSSNLVVSYKRKYVHKLLVNRLLKPAQEKVWLIELTVPQ